MVVCDTHAILFWAAQPERHPKKAAARMDLESKNGALGCADIVLWEIAMLAATQPADRLIVATALCHRAPLISGDEKIAAIAGLDVIW